MPQTPALIIAQNPMGESKLLVHTFTAEQGKVSGIIRRPKNLLKQAPINTGTLCQLDWREKESTTLPWLSIELITSFAATYLSKPLELLQLHSICALLNKALPDREPNQSLYQNTIDILPTLDQNLETYLAWEQNFMKELGFELDWGRCAMTGGVEDIAYISPRTGRAVCRSTGEPYKDKLIPMPQTIADKLRLMEQFMAQYFFAEISNKNAREKCLPLPRRQLSAAAQEFADRLDSAPS